MVYTPGQVRERGGGGGGGGGSGRRRPYTVIPYLETRGEPVGGVWGKEGQVNVYIKHVS